LITTVKEFGEVELQVNVIGFSQGSDVRAQVDHIVRGWIAPPGVRWDVVERVFAVDDIRRAGILAGDLSNDEAYSGEEFLSGHRRVEMKDGPFTSRIGLPHSNLKETDRRRVSYHWLLPG